MSRLAICCALALLLPGAAQAETYRAGPLGAWMQNGEFSCEGGDLVLFDGAEFAIVPRAEDDRTMAVIDSRHGRAKVGGNVADDLARLQDDPAICAGPIDCDDWDAVGKAIERCWSGDGPINRSTRP